MGHQLIKPVKDEDFYVFWSSFSDGPVRWGTREQIEKHLNKPKRGERWATKDEIKQMLDTADECGSENRSQFGMTWAHHSGPYRLGGTAYELPREKIKAFVEVWGVHDFGWGDFDHPDYADILIHTPFED